jgi:acyl-CoA thioesterase-1
VRAQRIIEHVVHRGVAGLVPRRSAGSRALGVAVLLVVLLVVLLASTLTLYAARARGADLPRCERFAADSVARAHAVSGSGERVVVLGDSYSAGLGLFSPASSWPSRLRGTVHVAGFSGSGFSPGASECAGVSFADRAPAALRGGADLVVVEGGLNDEPGDPSLFRGAVARTVKELRRATGGAPIVLLGPATPGGTPSAALTRIDKDEAAVAKQLRVPYVSPLEERWINPTNVSTLVDPATGHPSTEGHLYFGARLAQALGRIVRTR